MNYIEILFGVLVMATELPAWRFIFLGACLIMAIIAWRLPQIIAECKRQREDA